MGMDKVITITPIVVDYDEKNDYHSLKYVMCAANRYTHKFTGKVIIVPGLRHYDHKIMRPLLDMLDITHINYNKPEQGFIDTRGNFLNREEAMVLAKQCNQLANRVGGDTVTLFSENLY